MNIRLNEYDALFESRGGHCFAGSVARANRALCGANKWQKSQLITMIAKVDGAFMFGPDWLVTPVTQPGVAQWKVYLPRWGRSSKVFFTGHIKMESLIRRKTQKSRSLDPEFFHGGNIYFEDALFSFRLQLNVVLGFIFKEPLRMWFHILKIVINIW